MDLLKNQQMAEPIDGIYQDLETLLMQNIIRHCQDYDQPIATDEWLLKKLAEVGKLNQENIKTIARYAGLSQTAVERMLNDAAEEALDQVEPGLAYLTRRGLAGEAVELTRSKRVQRTMDTLQGQAKDTMNLCNTTMLYKARDAFQKLVRDTASNASEIENKQEFLNGMNKHASAVVLGIESRQQAMRKCIQEFNDRGIPAFVDKAGREWTPEAYVNMVMRNTARSVADEVQTARCLDRGVHLIQIDSHSGARPKCARDQGQIFDLNNGSGETEDARGRKIRYEPWNSSSYGEPDGILGINCGHHKFPFVPGVNIRSYFPTEDMDANDRLYKQTQIQRALERDVRKQKRLCMLYNESGDTEAFEKMAVKLKQKEANLKSYVDGNPELHRRKDREQVIGFDRSVSSKAVAANKKVMSKLQQKKRVEEVRPIMSAQEVAEFANLKKKYKSLDEAMLFGSPDEMERYKVLQKKQVEAAPLNDFKTKFENQNLSESTLNSWRDDPNERERDAISSYSRTGYLMMNGHLRHKNHVPNKVKEEIKELADYLEKCTIKSELHLKRGTDYNALNHLLGDGWQSNLSGQIGKVISDKGFLSTTPYKGGGFEGDMQMYIKAPKGTKGAYIKDYCANPDEKEFLLQRGTKLEVKNIEEVKNKWGDSQYTIHMEVIADE